jgi:hypothetical protein
MCHVIFFRSFRMQNVEIRVSVRLMVRDVDLLDCNMAINISDNPVNSSFLLILRGRYTSRNSSTMSGHSHRPTLKQASPSPPRPRSDLTLSLSPLSISYIS